MCLLATSFAGGAMAAKSHLGATSAQTAQQPDAGPPGQAPGQLGAMQPGSSAELNAELSLLTSDSVTAIVNDTPVTEYDVRQRMLLFIATSGVQPTQDNLKKLRGQIVDQLEDEQLQIQEAKRKDISVSMPEVDKSIDRIVTENHLTLDNLKDTLAKHGVEFATLREQIAAQLIWQKAVEDEFQDRINVSQQDIDAELARQAQFATKTHYEVSEIFLPVDTPDQDARVQGNISDLETQLQQGAPFALVARQFSQSPSAASGGDIGWVHEGELPQELNEALATMTPVATSQPIRSLGGYYILQLRDRAEAAGTKIAVQPVEPAGPVTSLALVRILLPLGPKPTQQIAESAMKAAAEIGPHIVSCKGADKIAAQIHGAVYQDLGTMKLAELDPRIADLLLKTEAGQAAPPFADAAGVELFARCDKAVPKEHAWPMPTRDQVEEQLFDAQVTAFARRYMRDLRRQADVETRTSDIR